MRPESSVSVGRNVLGELVFACDRPGPVIHRTPEELGIPRVVVAAKPRGEAATVDDRAARAEAEKLHRAVEQRAKGVAAKSRKEQPEVLRGAPDDKCKGDGMTNELKAKVLAEPDAAVDDLVKRLGVSRSQVYNWRHEARKKSGAPAARKSEPRAQPVSALQRTIDVDPQRKGTAHALLTALAKRDAAGAVTVRLELTEGEVAALIGKLNDEQRGAFLAAGLKAAILG